jgi:hypothetical protein
MAVSCSCSIYRFLYRFPWPNLPLLLLTHYLSLASQETLEWKHKNFLLFFGLLKYWLNFLGWGQANWFICLLAHFLSYVHFFYGITRHNAWIFAVLLAFLDFQFSFPFQFVFVFQTYIFFLVSLDIIFWLVDHVRFSYSVGLHLYISECCALWYKACAC